MIEGKSRNRECDHGNKTGVGKGGYPNPGNRETKRERNILWKIRQYIKGKGKDSEKDRKKKAFFFFFLFW